MRAKRKGFVMRMYSNMTSRRLEKMAHRLGVDCGIKVAEAQEDGRYFVVTFGDESLQRPIALGFTDEEAGYAIKSRRWERFVLRGEPSRWRPSISV